jgi:hypothetical protein
MVLVFEPGQSPADERARSLFKSLSGQFKNEDIVPVLVDLSVSRNRADAAQYHITATPLLVCLTPKKLIVTRDEAPITKELILNRMTSVATRSHELDAKLAALKTRAVSDVTAQSNLADFLLAQHNAREAIPSLEAVAHSEAADQAQRVRAWVELAQAHLWIAEPEKGRHEARALIDTLKTPAAVAGGNLVLGTQDANAKRFALARQEFTAAVAAAPESDYGKQAATALAQLPEEHR